MSHPSAKSTAGQVPHTTRAAWPLAGDDEAFVAAVHVCQERVLRMVGRFVPVLQDAEDIVQEAILEAYRQLPRFRGEASFDTWLYRIALYKALAVVRRANRRPTTHEDCQTHDADDTDTALAARAAVARLPTKLRLPVVLRFYEGLSGDEIAQLLGCKQSTVWTRVYRALARLRMELEEDELQ